MTYYQYDEPIGPCPKYCGYCDRQVETSIRRQNTAYVDEDLNWIVCCDECIVWINEEWDQLWQEYYASRW